MPDRIKLPPNDDVKALVQSAIDIPVFHFQARIGLLQLADTDFDTLQHRILYIFHSICHGHFEFNHFRSFLSLERFGNGNMKTWPERRFS